jgi:hypothetical protein
MEYGGQLQYLHDFVPYKEAGSSAFPYELTPNAASSSTGSLWNDNRNASGGGLEGQMIVHDPRNMAWGFPVDCNSRSFLDDSGNGPTTDTVESQWPSGNSKSAQTSHSDGLNMVLTGYYEPSSGVIMGLKEINRYSNPSSITTDFYADPDGTVRRGVAAYVGGVSSGVGNMDPNLSNNWSYQVNTTYGLPTATTVTTGALVTGTAISPPPLQSQSRPIILHRPYRSVAELGYVFSGTPWKNVDFSTPESGYSALLDVFCINEDKSQDAVVEGRVDLNTRQIPVLQAILNGAYRDAESSTTTLLGSYTAEPPLGAPSALVAESGTIAQLLVNRTTQGPATGPNAGVPQPLFNIADLVGRWKPNGQQGSMSNPIDGSANYDGFSADLAAYMGSSLNTANTPSGNYNILPRFRETAIRALSSAGQAGTWNLMIDVIAQTGRYPIGATDLSKFVVEGERRFWVHVAISRETAQIVDESIEPVNE